MRRLRIFAASTADTATERAKVETAAGLLKPLADRLDIVLDVVDWRAAVPDMGRPEQVILDQLKPTEWDVLVGILWHRFGTPAGGADPDTQAGYASGTEEEFKTAYRLWLRHGRPRIMVYRCTRPIPPDALDPDQFKRVKEFFSEFAAEGGKHPGLYQSFDTPNAFERLLLDNLQKLLLTYGEQLGGRPVEVEDVREIAPGPPDNLPRRSSFFGRDREMNEVMRALSPEDRTWGVLVDGIGGIGKTALAVEAAHRCKERGQFAAYVFVSAKQTLLTPGRIRELTPPAQTLDEFLNETARVLGQSGIPKLPGDAKRRALIDALRQTPALLVYDNLETLTKGEQEAMADFLRELPQGCKAIITSRRRGGEGAVWLRLEKLDWDAARQMIAQEADRDARLGDKLRRAGESGWHQLYDATGGSPLALSHTLGLMRVRASLSFDAALDLLRGNHDPDLQNFIFQQARREFTNNDEAALRALSFFAPSATFEAWSEVSQLSRTALDTTIDRLSALSLVDILTGEDRYALHPLTRNFIRDELLADEQTDRETGMRFADYWVAFAQRSGGSDKNYKTFPLIEAEWPNLNAATEWLWVKATIGEEEIGFKDAAMSLDNLSEALCCAGGPWFYIGRWDEIFKLNARAYKVMRILGDWGMAGRKAYQVAGLYYYRGAIEEAQIWAERCAEAWALGGTEDDQAAGMQMHGMVAMLQGNYTTAEQFFKDALAFSRSVKSNLDVAKILGNLGNLEAARENYDAAERYYQEALTLDEQVGSEAGMANRYACLSSIELGRKRWGKVLEWGEKALSLSHKIGRHDLIAISQFYLARVYEETERPKLALSLAQEALEIYEKLQHKLLQDTRELVERLKKKTDTP